MFIKVILFSIFIFCFSGFAVTGEKGAETISGKCRESDKLIDAQNQSFAILSKPPARYTDEARANATQGTIRLSVTFLGTGKIGAIEVIKGLPDGLTRQAVNAAKKICFRPAIIDGTPKDVVKELSYSFTIY